MWLKSAVKSKHAIRAVITLHHCKEGRSDGRAEEEQQISKECDELL